MFDQLGGIVPAHTGRFFMSNIQRWLATVTEHLVWCTHTCQPVSGEIHTGQGQTATPSWQCACTAGGWNVADGQ